MGKVFMHEDPARVVLLLVQLDHKLHVLDAFRQLLSFTWVVLHRRLQFAKGDTKRAKDAVMYPPELCRALCKGILKRI